MFALLKRPIVIAILGLVLVALFVWFVGPYFSFGFGDAVVQPLASETSRFITIGAIVTVWALVVLLKRVKTARAGRQLMAAVVKPPTVAPPTSGDVQLRERFEEA